MIQALAAVPGAPPPDRGLARLDPRGRRRRARGSTPRPSRSRSAGGRWPASRSSGCDPPGRGPDRPCGRPDRIGGILGLVEDVQPIHLDLRLDSPPLSRQLGTIRRHGLTRRRVGPIRRGTGRRVNQPRDQEERRPGDSRDRDEGLQGRLLEAGGCDAGYGKRSSAGPTRGRPVALGTGDSRPAPSRPGGKAHEPRAIHRSISRLILRRADFVKGNQGAR